MDSPYSLSRLQTLFQNNVALLAKRSLASRAEEADRAAAYPEDLIADLAKTGLLSLLTPRDLGGQGAGVFELALALEELAAACPASALFAASQNLAGGLFARAGSETRKTNWLPGIMQGKIRFGYLVSPTTALNPLATPLAIRDTGDGPVLDGPDVWLANGAQADLLALWAKGEKQTVFMVIPARNLPAAPQPQPGLTGFEAMAPVLAQVNGVPVSSSDILNASEPNLLSWFGATTALTNAAVAMGAARGAQEYALGYSRQRHQFGLPIGSFQAVKELLAEMALAVEASRQLTLKACAAHDANHDTAPKLTAMARLMAVRCAAQATAQAVQVCGGYGYTKEYPIEKMMRLAQLCKGLDGGDQAQLMALAATL